MNNKKLEIKGNTFYITDAITGQEWKVPSKNAGYEDNRANSVTFYDTTKKKPQITIDFANILNSSGAAFADFQALTDWNDDNLGKSSADGTAVTTRTFTINNQCYIRSGVTTDWRSASSYSGWGNGDILSSSTYANADTTPNSQIPSFATAYYRCKLSHFTIEGRVTSSSDIDFKIIKGLKDNISTNSMSDIVVLMDTLSFSNASNEVLLISKTISDGLNDIEINIGESIILLLKITAGTGSYRSINFKMHFTEIV